MLNYLTPHGKWHIHSTYGDNHRMMTLSRGIEPFWINDKDAAEHRHRRQRLGRGAQRPRGRVHPGGGHAPHAPGHLHHLPLPGTHLGVPKSPLRGNRPAGGGPQQPDPGAPQAQR